MSASRPIRDDLRDNIKASFPSLTALLGVAAILVTTLLFLRSVFLLVFTPSTPSYGTMVLYLAVVGASVFMVAAKGQRVRSQSN